MSEHADIRTIGVIGAGVMGRGIAQLFAQSGHPVLLHDIDGEAARRAHGFVAQMIRRRAEKGELSPQQAEATIDRISIVPDLAGFSVADLVIEAVAERLDIKQALFTALESIMREDAILATNTSSLMVTAIASRCSHPARLAGYHFFNPVPLMKLIEVVRGERTDPVIIERLCALARSVGYHPVVTADTPGFVVNHAGRALVTEGLQLLQDCVATPAAIDTLMRDIAGFRMGPFELFDLTGIDVSGPVVESIHAQYFCDPRYRSSPILRRRIAAGLYGRKTGEGFYSYDGQQIRRPPELRSAPASLPAAVFIDDAQANPELVALIERLGAPLDHGNRPAPDSLIVVAPIGSDCATICSQKGYSPERTVAIETFFGMEKPRRCLSVPVGAKPVTVAAAQVLFGSDGTPVTVCNDSVALVVQRIVAVIVNLGCEIAQQQIACPEDIDMAVRTGLGYPDGPLGLGDRYGPERILRVLEGLLRHTGDPRYRPSGWLRRRAQLGLSLCIPDYLRG